MCKVYGYARISKQKQSIERQIRNINAEYPSAIIVKEAYTGTKIDRKEWNKLVRIVKGGDTIVFDSVSRMSRNAAEGFVPLTTLMVTYLPSAFFSKMMLSAAPEPSTVYHVILDTVLSVRIVPPMTLTFAETLFVLPPYENTVYAQGTPRRSKVQSLTVRFTVRTAETLLLLLP